MKQAPFMSLPAAQPNLYDRPASCWGVALGAKAFLFVVFTFSLILRMDPVIAQAGARDPEATYHALFRQWGRPAFATAAEFSMATLAAGGVFIAHFPFGISAGRSPFADLLNPDGFGMRFRRCGRS